MAGDESEIIRMTKMRIKELRIRMNKKMKNIEIQVIQPHPVPQQRKNG